MERRVQGSEVVLGSMRGPSQVNLAHRDLGTRERTDTGGIVGCGLLAVASTTFAARGSD